MTDRGVIFIVTGDRFTDAAVEATRSIRATNPGLPVHLFSDCDPPSADLFDGITRIENGHARSKVDYVPESPFERTLYLDVDVRVVADIGEMFDVLDRFDIALAHAHARNRPQTNQLWRHPIPPAFPQLNGGVLLYRTSPQVLAMLRQWRDAYHQAGFKKDQVTLRELIWLSDLRLAVLPPEYNVRYPKYLRVWAEREAKPKILHFPEYHPSGTKEPRRGLASLFSLVKRLGQRKG